MRAAFAALLMLFASAGCAAEPGAVPPFVPHALSGTVSWQPLAQREAGTWEAGKFVVVYVKGGELLRLETPDDAPFDVGERAGPAAASAVDEWVTVTPHAHVALVRPPLFTTAVLLPRGAVTRALVGRGYDPGYRWFELEARVIDWASGPLPARFPVIAPPERIDLDAFAALDGALADAVGGARDRDGALAEARAIRRVVGLRVARSLRPVNGFPYFFDDIVVPEGTPKTHDEAGRRGYEVTPVAPLSLVVSGPTLLHLWSRAPRSEGGEVERLRVTEDGRERAVSGATLPRSVRNTASDPARPESDPEDASAMTSLRRAVVNVPPGEHRYRVEVGSGERLWVYPLRAREIVHVEDAISGAKSESVQLERAEAACRTGVPAICAFALALGGKDSDERPLDGSTLGWRAALAALSPPAREIAGDLSRGGPRDPSLALELAASAGSEEALAKLSDAAARETDETLRDAWMRAVVRGTRWVGVEGEAGGTWSAVATDGGAGATCSRAGGALAELGSKDLEIATTSWNGLRAVELEVDAPCDRRGAIELAIDGETLTASPSSGRTRWHILVHGATAHAKRLDSGGGRVLALPASGASCGSHWESVPEPRLASARPKLVYGGETRAPGVEIWLRRGARAGTVLFEASDGKKASVAVRETQGDVSAIDGRGIEWLRAARVPLPSWAAGGVEASGNGDVGVRAIVREPRPSGSKPAASGPADALDEAKLVELSRAILALPGSERGPLYLQRAFLLARGGARSAALADARAARALGAGGGDPEGEIREALRSKPRSARALDPAVKAYGVEADFDPGAQRCKANETGPRGRLARALEQKAGDRAWDPTVAAHALEVARQNLNDPRAESLTRRAMRGSHWELVRSVQGSAQRVLRPRPATDPGPTDAQGSLRPKVAAGDPFAGSSYVVVTNAQPARAILAPAGGAAAHVEAVCVARDPASVAREPRCPLQISLGDPALAIAITEKPSGNTYAPLPLLSSKAGGQKLSLTMRDAPGNWIALARVVFDREVPGATKIAGVGWVLDPPARGKRFLLKPGESIAVEGPLVRIDALPEPGGAPRVIATADGHETPVPADGAPVTVIASATSATIRAEGGAVTLSIARRVPRAPSGTPEGLDGDDAVEAADEGDESPAPAAAILLDPGAIASAASWRRLVDRLPAPLTALEDDLGVVVGGITASYGSFRADTPEDRSVDEALEEFVGYRRRIERLSLWTIASANFAERPNGAAPTYGGTLTLYEDYDPAHLRISGTFDFETQQIEGAQVQTINPRGFVEYSWRPARSFFILPRLGYDGWYTTLKRAPRTTVNVDDGVYNAFRSQRQTFAFLQSLFWLTPFINDIFYVRLRATYDVGNGELSHVAARPGALLAFAALDVNAFFESAWYEATPTVRTTAGFTNSAAVTVEYNFWSGSGSLDVQPGVAAFWNDGGAYTLQATLSLSAGYRRGLRDYSSLELDFPEQLSDGVPWRGAPLGVAR